VMKRTVRSSNSMPDSGFKSASMGQIGQPQFGPTTTGYSEKKPDHARVSRERSTCTR
jgi:hypothetical protein